MFRGDVPRVKAIQAHGVIPQRARKQGQFASKFLQTGPMFFLFLWSCVVAGQ